jgi:hypothetical protein
MYEILDATELLALIFHKSTWSMNQGCCVEVAKASRGRVVVRDSKDRGGPMLVFGPEQWDCFLAGAKAGEFR